MKKSLLNNLVLSFSAKGKVVNKFESKFVNKFVNIVNDGLINLRNPVIKIEIIENENQNKIVGVVENIIDFNKQQKSKKRPSNLARRIKILATKQMFQRLPIALAQIKADNSYESLLNEIRQIIYSLYWKKEFTQTVYSKKMNSVKL